MLPLGGGVGAVGVAFRRRLGAAGVAVRRGVEAVGVAVRRRCRGSWRCR